MSRAKDRFRGFADMLFKPLPVSKAAAPASPSPSSVPKPPMPPPRGATCGGMQVSPRTGLAEVPCMLTREQLASTEPSEYALRIWRRAQAAFEAEQRAQEEREQAAQLRRYLGY
jgi:hypothetical protein